MHQTLRWPWRLCITSAALAIAALFTTSTLLQLSACSGWVLNAIALIACFIIYKRSRQPNVDANQRRTPLLLIGGISLALCVVHTAINLTIFSNEFRLLDYRAIYPGILTNIGDAIDDYCARHGRYPASPQDLVREEGLTDKQFISPRDPAALPYDVTRYTSYCFLSGQGTKQNNPDIILMHEREPFSTVEYRILFTKYGRLTLFDDGHVELLDEEHFQAAIRKDRQRRRELGWPSPDTQPASQPAK